MKIRPEDVKQAAERLGKVIHRIPLERSATFSAMSGSNLFLKCENRQKTGSFKIRGAYNKIARLLCEKDVKAVVASSAGNHAQGVAFAASALGIGATIVMPKSTPIAKIAATEGYGAKVLLHGDCYDDAYEKAIQIQREAGHPFIHPFDDYDVMAGQATVGLEILADLPGADTVILPAGGGGLLAGAAFYLKSMNPGIRVVGVQAEGADAILRSFQKEGIASLDNVHTIADGIAVKSPGSLTVSLINRYVDEMVTVSDDEIAGAILLLLERTKQMVEPAGAASLAAVLNEKVNIAGKNAVCVLTGGNIDVSFIHKIIEKGLVKRGRQMKFAAVMPDIPGSLAKFSKIISDAEANIILVQYDRLHVGLNVNEVILHIACEVGGLTHGRRLVDSLERSGYRVTIES